MERTMKNYGYYLLVGLLLSGCMSAKSTRPSGAKPDCKSSDVSHLGKNISTKFCIQKVFLKPSNYSVQVNGERVFVGSDHRRVIFEKRINDGVVIGGCDAYIKLHGAKEEPDVPISLLSSEIIEGCGITSDNNGNVQVFRKDVACDKVFYKHLRPILGKATPVEVSRQCTIRLDGKVIFDKKFNL